MTWNIMLLPFYCKSFNGQCSFELHFKRTWCQSLQMCTSKTIVIDIMNYGQKFPERFSIIWLTTANCSTMYPVCHSTQWTQFDSWSMWGIFIHQKQSRFLFSTQIWHLWHFCTLKGFKKFHQKIKFPSVGIELTSPTITGLEVLCWSNSANLSFLASLRLWHPYKLMLYWI